MIRLTGLLFGFLLLQGTTSVAQIEMSSFTATGRAGVSTTLLGDYECQGINPANLAHKPELENKNFCLGLAEFGLSVYSDALDKNDLSSALFNPDRKLSNEEKRRAGQAFAEKALTANLDFLYGGLSYQSSDGVYGFAITMRERAQWYSKFSELASEIMFNGINAKIRDSVTNNLVNYFQNFDTTRLKDASGNPIIDANGNYLIDTLAASTLVGKALKLSRMLDGTRITMLWNREFALDYGLNLINRSDFKWNAGVGIKFIQGIGYLDLKATEGQYSAVIAASPTFGIEFPDKSPINAEVGFLPSSSGRGFGFEFGTSLEFGEHWRIAGSISDIGSVSYKTNVYTASDAPLQNLSSKGFSNYNFFQNPEQFDGFSKDMINWKGDVSLRQGLPTRSRFGVSFSSKILNIGGDLVFPMNNNAGNLLKPVASVGGDLLILKFIRVSSGMLVGGNYTYALIPFGITVRPFGSFYEFGIATRDVMTYLRKSNPMLSLSTGFLRFRI